MFSTCSTIMQNQAFLPLSSIISQYSNIKGQQLKVKCRQKDPATLKDADISNILCSERLSETLEKFLESDVKEIRRLVTPKVLHCLALYGPDLLISQMSSLSIRPYHSMPFSILKERKKWYESHISCNTFLENKQSSTSFSDVTHESQFRPQVRITQKLMRSQHNCSASYVPCRGFKTKQFLERSKLREGVAPFKREESLEQKTSQEESAAEKSGGDSKLDKLNFARLLFLHGHDNPKLKSMLAKDVPKDVQRDMKVAFAEGYLQADANRFGSRPFKLLRPMFYIILSSLILGISYLFVGYGGSVFKMNVPHESEVYPEDNEVSFDDVRGVDVAKDELQDIVKYLKHPEKYTSLGAELPKGALLIGPPGTGKTLLARAVAGEAGVPFFHAAGPEFDEILVGQGARRIRDLFRAAKAKAPCVVFIDEIDSVGSRRSNSVLHPFANQTINQLLTEMDGFFKNEGIIVLGATNRPNDLDPALRRPGRFDLEITVPKPDRVGREDIFNYYLSKLKISGDVSPKSLSRLTIGFTGADIKNLTNTAALKAAGDSVEYVSMKHLEAAREKMVLGSSNNVKPDEETNRITAYHEAGHVLVSYYVNESRKLYKVTIIPRGKSMGLTSHIPVKEEFYQSKTELLDFITTALGGRAAEEIVFGPDHITGGASDDLMKATLWASSMVKYLGMGTSIGQRVFLRNEDAKIADSLKDSADGEINRILQECYERSKKILITHTKELEAVAEALLKYETLDGEDIKAIIDGREPK